MGVAALVWVFPKRCPYFPSGRHDFGSPHHGNMALTVLHREGLVRGQTDSLEVVGWLKSQLPVWPGSGAAPPRIQIELSDPVYNEWDLQYKSVSWWLTMRVLGPVLGMLIFAQALAQLRQEHCRRQSKIVDAVARSRPPSSPLTADAATTATGAELLSAETTRMLWSWSVEEFTCTVEGMSCVLLGLGMALGQFGETREVEV